MPIARIQGPDGKTYKIEVPEGASEQDILSFAQSQYKEQPKEENSFLSNLAGGFGQSVEDTVKGIAQAGLGAGEGLASMVGANEIAQNLAGGKSVLENQIKADEPQRQELLSTGGGFIGNVAGNVAQTALPAKYIAPALKAIPTVAKAAPLLADVLASGAYGAAQPVGQDGSRLENAAWEGVASGLGSALASRAGSGKKAGSAALVKKADELGIPLGIAQTTESPLIKYIASLSNTMSLTNPQKRIQEGLNRAVGQTFGAEGNVLSEGVMEAAKDRLGNVFDKAAQYGIKDAKGLGSDLSYYMASLEGNYPKDVIDLVGRKAADVADLSSSGSLSGNATKNMSKILRDETYKAYKAGDSVVGEALGGLSKAFEQSMMGNLPEEVAQELLSARGQYKNLKAIAPLVSKNAGNVPAGQLPSRVASQFNNNTIKAGDLGDIANISAQYLKKLAPESGTATKQLMLQLAAPIVGATAYGSGASPETSAAIALGSTGMSELLSSPFARKIAVNMLRGVRGVAPQYTAPALVSSLSNRGD